LRQNIDFGPRGPFDQDDALGKTIRKLAESAGQPGHQLYGARLGKVTATGEASSQGAVVPSFG
jgi:hypothetical protein